MQAVATQQRIIEVIERCAADATETNDRELRSRIGSAIAAMVRGWDILEERKRILRNKPLPGHLRPDLQPKPKRILPQFTSMEAIDVSEQRAPLSSSLTPKESLSLPADRGGTPTP